MHPLGMGAALGFGFTLFAWSAWRRLRAVAGAGGVAALARALPLDALWARLRRVFDQAILQRTMRREPFAGLAHLAISAGFVVLLLRTLVLWGRGFDPAYQPWIFGVSLGGGWSVGVLYGLLKDLSVAGVLGGVAYFAYLRLFRRSPRLTLNAEGVVILGGIALMMVADVLYDGAVLALADSVGALSTTAVGEERLLAHLDGVVRSASPRLIPDPLGSTASAILRGLPPASLRGLAEAGYWVHSLVVLVLLNLLPHGKHFHVLVAVPNLFFAPRQPPGHLAPLAKSTAALDRLIDAAAELPDPHAAPLGIARLEHLSPKGRLDLFACTECGRCTARCPASLTGKTLRPKSVIVALRAHLREQSGRSAAATVDLVPNVIASEVAWACTTCRACEDECPVGVRFVDKLVGLRRHLVTVRGEGFPIELGRLFTTLETHGNPHGRLPRERMDWASGLDVRTAAERPTAETLFWVGCAATFDPRARRIARATAALFQTAGVDFAVLGPEESCTGDVARRAGNESLFLALAERNLAVLDRYAAAGGVRRIVTGCPHCLHTLRDEYPDLGARYPVAHTAALLAELVDAGRLSPRTPVAASAVVHDACYLARREQEPDATRNLLRRVPGLALVEAADHGRRTFCCGGGGAQAWLEEQNTDRIAHRRARDLAQTGAEVVATSCPYCMTMLADGLAATAASEPARPRDVVELVAEACGVAEAPRP